MDIEKSKLSKGRSILLDLVSKIEKENKWQSDSTTTGEADCLIQGI